MLALHYLARRPPSGRNSAPFGMRWLIRITGSSVMPIGRERRHARIHDVASSNFSRSLLPRRRAAADHILVWAHGNLAAHTLRACDSPGREEDAYARRHSRQACGVYAKGVSVLWEATRAYFKHPPDFSEGYVITALRSTPQSRPVMSACGYAGGS
ncbi:hypothetical protein FKP32DRAFT_1187265 [Trametes sanguinea]|nr:hypothetical protein FKP32DRAFT_1187265 [Trametes sanguinea]